ncbi:MAG: TldD/PmbA family protein [Candidatus Saccharicenans sp.]|jgi:PmbA protein|nr:TldD/PmbA family protein [Candidatus Saccharicenans sp.]
MKQELYDLADKAIKIATAAGADDCRVSINGGRFVEINYRERRPEGIKEATSRGLQVEIFVNKRYSVQTTSDLRPQALKSFIEKAVASTRLLEEDPLRTLPDPKYYQGRQNIDLKQFDPDYKKLTPENRHSFVRAIEESCLAKGGDKVISVTASGYDSYSEQAHMASNGFDGYVEYTAFYGAAEMTARDEGNRRPAEYNVAIAMNRKDLPRAEEIGAEAAARALSLLGAKKIKTETLPIIIENRVAGQVASGLLQAMFGRSIQQKQSFLADKKGQKVGSERLTLIDDPFIPSGLGSRTFDGEGIAAKKMTMIEAGVLREFYIDWYYGRKLGWEPTSGSPSNLVIPPGKHSVKEIMKDLGRGIFVTGFIGGNSNSTTGDFSIGIIGQLFDKGEIVHPVSEMNIADNHLKFWQRLVEAANDPYTYSQMRFPSLVFDSVVVSGI